MDSTFGAGVLGKDYLPPSPVYPIDQLIAGGGAAPPANAAATSGFNVPVGPAAPGPPPIASPAPTAGGGAGAGGSYLQQILGALGPQQQSGFSAPRFMSALGAGLSSAGQNWNKPGAAAFASGAGAAIQGGQQFDNQMQSAKLKALQTAIAAWKAGDLAAYHRALTNFRAASAQQQRPAASAAPAAPPAASGSAPANNPPAPSPGVTGSASGPTVNGSPPPPVAPPSPATVGASAPRLSAPDAFAQARDAIGRGASRDAVIQRLRVHGFDPAGL